MWVLLLLLPLGALADCGPPSPCHNGGTCSFETYWPVPFQCDCPQGWKGKTCEEDATIRIQAVPATVQPTANTLMTTTNAKSTTMTTTPRARTVNEDINECENTVQGGRTVRASHKCQNGTCVNKMEGYECNCKKGFKGKLCDTKRSCKDAPCLNGGTCTEKDAPPFFQCECPGGFRGKRCKWKTPKRNPCFDNPCDNGGTCSNVLQNFSCDCAPGWEGNKCQHRLEVCHNDSCSHRGQCEEQEVLGLGFVAKCSNCTHGYTGDRCEIDQVDQINQELAQRNAEIEELKRNQLRIESDLHSLKEKMKKFLSFVNSEKNRFC